MNKTPKWEGVVTKAAPPVRVNPSAKAWSYETIIIYNNKGGANFQC